MRGFRVSMLMFLGLISRGLVKLPVQVRGLDPAAFAARRTQYCVLAEQAQHIQAAFGQILERDVVVLGDRCQPDMEFGFVILGANVKGRADFGHRAKPIAAHDMRDILLQLDDAFAGAAFARK